MIHYTGAVPPLIPRLGALEACLDDDVSAEAQRKSNTRHASGPNRL